MPTISQLPPLDQVTSSDQIPVSQTGETHSVSVGTLLASMQPAVISESARCSAGPVSVQAGPSSIAVGQGLVLNAGTLTLAVSGSELASYPLQTSLLPTDQVVLNSGGDAKLLSLSSLRGLFSAGANVTISSSGTISMAAAEGSLSGQSIASLVPVTSMASSDLVAINQGGTDHAIAYQNFVDGQTIDAASTAAPASDMDAFWVGQGSSTMVGADLRRGLDLDQGEAAELPPPGAGDHHQHNA